MREQAQPSGSGSAGTGDELRINVPVFVRATNGFAAPKQSWIVSDATDKGHELVLHNAGNAHVQVLDFALYAPDSDRPVAGEPVSSWIFGGQSRTWKLEAEAADSPASGRLRFKAYTDAGDIDAKFFP